MLFNLNSQIRQSKPRNFRVQLCSNVVCRVAVSELAGCQHSALKLPRVWVEEVNRDCYNCILQFSDLSKGQRSAPHAGLSRASPSILIFQSILVFPLDELRYCVTDGTR